MSSSPYQDEDEIRAVPFDRLAPSHAARMLTFAPRMTDAERWQRLRAVDPRSAAMLETAFRKMYAFHFPDD